MTLYDLLFSPMFKIRAYKQKHWLKEVHERGIPYLYGEFIDCEQFKQSYFAYFLTGVDLVGSFDKINLFYDEGYYLNTPSNVKKYEITFYIRASNPEFDVNEDLFNISIYTDGEYLKYKLNLGKNESFHFEVSLQWMANELGDPELAELPREWVEKVYYMAFPYRRLWD